MFEARFSFKLTRIFMKKRMRKKNGEVKRKGKKIRRKKRKLIFEQQFDG